MYYFFQFQCGLISEDEKYPFPPRFTRFLGISGPKGPSVLLLELAREVMMGPRTGNAQKTGKTEAEMGILKLNNGNVRNLKISMLHIVL